MRRLSSRILTSTVMATRRSFYVEDDPHEVQFSRDYIFGRSKYFPENSYWNPELMYQEEFFNRFHNYSVFQGDLKYLQPMMRQKFDSEELPAGARSAALTATGTDFNAGFSADALYNQGSANAEVNKTFSTKADLAKYRVTPVEGWQVKDTLALMELVDQQNFWTIVFRDFPTYQSSGLGQAEAQAEFYAFYKDMIQKSLTADADTLEKEAYPFVLKAFEEWGFHGHRYWRLTESLLEALSAHKTATKRSARAVQVTLERVTKSILNAHSRLPCMPRHGCSPDHVQITQARQVADAGLW